MARSQETYNKKDVRDRKEKKRKEKEKKRLAKKENEKSGHADDMIAYVDEFGMITSTPPDASKKITTNLEDIQISTPKKESMESFNAVRTGVVNFFDNTKGFGFINDNETKRDVFVHINNLLEEIKEGNIVTFEIEKGPKGIIAVRVKLLK